MRTHTDTKKETILCIIKGAVNKLGWFMQAK